MLLGWYQIPVSGFAYNGIVFLIIGIAYRHSPILEEHEVIEPYQTPQHLLSAME